MEQIVYLDSTDDILTIRDRLNLAQAGRVLLVIPPYSDVLRSRVDLRLVQRQAQQSRVEVALVTRDSEIRREAREIELPVFSSIEQGQTRRRWRRSEEDDETWMPGRSDEAWRAAAARQANTRVSRPVFVMKHILAWAMFIGVFVAFGAAAILTVPSAQIVLIPHSEPINITTYVALDSDLEKIDVVGARVPATYVSVQVEGNAQVATTGKKAIPSSTSKGAVVFINQLGIPINIPKGTAVRTSAFGTVIRYFTTADVTVPGGFGAQVEAPIEAMEPGEFANVPANLINEVEGVAAISVKVTNSQPTSGGGSLEAPAVTQEDRDRVRSQLLQQLVQDAYIQMQNGLEDQEFIPAESLFVSEVLDETYDRFVTEEAPVLSLQMQVTVLGLKVDMQEANALVYADMVSRVPEGYELIADKLAFKRGEIILPADANGDILMQMSGTGYVAARFDQDQIRRDIAGKSVDDAANYLARELPLQVGPDIDVKPGWLGRVPWLPLRIEIEVKTRT